MVRFKKQENKIEKGEKLELLTQQKYAVSKMSKITSNHCSQLDGRPDDIVHAKYSQIVSRILALHSMAMRRYLCVWMCRFSETFYT